MCGEYIYIFLGVMEVIAVQGLNFSLSIPVVKTWMSGISPSTNGDCVGILLGITEHVEPVLDLYSNQWPLVGCAFL